MHLCISISCSVNVFWYQHFVLNSTFEQLPWDMGRQGVACSKVDTHWSKSCPHCTDTWREKNFYIKKISWTKLSCRPVIIFLFHHFLLLLDLFNNFGWQRGNQNPKVFTILNLVNIAIHFGWSYHTKNNVLQPVLCPNLVQLLSLSLLSTQDHKESCLSLHQAQK